jgi:pyruvyltransferase
LFTIKDIISNLYFSDMKTFIFFLSLSLALQADIPLYYYDSRIDFDFTNFGDMLSEKIVERIVGHPIETTFSKSYSFKQGRRKLLALGSILNFAQTNDVIWGSGVHGKFVENEKIYLFKDLDVRAVRGPLTREFLLKRGIHCPAVYGDPALLIPLLFPEFQKKENPSHEYIIIPHYEDESYFSEEHTIVSVKERWDVVIGKILDSKFVISSSLHGIIVAEAFGIPAKWLRLDDREPFFKYNDYYQGTNRYGYQFAETIEEALQMGGEEPPQCDLQKLLAAFPYDQFS